MSSSLQKVLHAGTNGANYGLSTPEIVDKLLEWDACFGIDVESATQDGMVVTFRELPADLRLLALDINQFCPDVVAQGFGCYEEIIDQAEEAGVAVDPEILNLSEGIDFNDSSYGIRLLTRSIERDRKVHLWWD